MLVQDNTGAWVEDGNPPIAAQLPGGVIAPQQPPQPWQQPPEAYNPDPMMMQNPSWGDGLDNFMSSPGMAMAQQALLNMSALRRGRVPNATPFSAMYDVRKQNQLLMDRKYTMAEDKRRYAEQQRLRDAQLEAMAFANKTNAAAVPNEYSNLPKEFQLWKLSGSTKPFDAWLAETGVSQQQLPAGIQEYLFANSLPGGPDEYYGRQFAPAPVKVGDVTYMVNKGTNDVTAIGPDGMETFADINSAIQAQAEKKAGAVATATAVGSAKGSSIAGAPARSAELDQMLSIVQQLKNDPSIDAVYGTLDGAVYTGRQGSVDAENKIQSLIAKLSLDARAKLAGQGSVSNFEGEQLGRSATTLGNYRASGDSARQELNNIEQILIGAKDRTGSLIPGADLGNTDGWKIERVE